MANLRFWQNWSWPTPGGRGVPSYPAPWQEPDMRPDQRPYTAEDQAQRARVAFDNPSIARRPYPPGAQPSRWYTSRVPRAGTQTAAVGGTALRQRFPDLPPKTVRPAFTGPYERRFARTAVGRNRAIYQPLMMLPAIKRPSGQAVRSTVPPVTRPALTGPRQRYSKVDQSALVAQARLRASGGSGRLGTRGV